MLKDGIRIIRQSREGDGDNGGGQFSEGNSAMLLALVRMFVAEKIDYCGEEIWGELATTLHELMTLTSSAEARTQIVGLLRRVGGATNAPQIIHTGCPQLEKALSMCTAPEPYVRVFGMRELEGLVRSVDGPPAELVAQRFTVLSLAVDALRSDESYVFLNAVRLLVALLRLMEADVMETMVAEYGRDAIEVDGRLKVGEAIVKLVEELGEHLFGFVWPIHNQRNPH